MRLLIFLFTLIIFQAQAQVLDTGDQLTEFKDGIKYQYKPAHFKTVFRFRMQNRFTYMTEDAERSKAEQTGFEVRRTRLRLDGTIGDPRLLYRLQLSFTRGDFDFDRTQYPNVLRDAAVGWQFTPHTNVWVGQTKLPGNRQRLISSGSQQFVDRSLLNSTFNIDRDIGLFLNHKHGDDKPVWIKLAVTNGGGRATNNDDNGMAYTARIEWLPLGSFTNGGDYWEGDLTREPEPKFSIAAAYSSNKKATRPNGQLGTQYETEGLNRNLENYFADMLFKYRGFAWSSEYARRWSNDPVFQDTAAGKEVVIYKGHGINTQASYIFENNIEIAGRYTQLWTDNQIERNADATKQYTVGVSKYLNEHRVKIQSDLSYTEDARVGSPDQQYWTYRLQLELGI